MKSIICLLVIAFVAGLTLADRCEWGYCHKDELHVCKDTGSDTEDRIKCNQENGLYVTYRKLPILPSSHKCCPNWRIEQISDKYLYCVRNVRDSKRKCSSEKKESYDFKIASKCKGHAFSCE